MYLSTLVLKYLAILLAIQQLTPLAGSSYLDANANIPSSPGEAEHRPVPE